jgi:RHS repeat-associated protein
MLSLSLRRFHCLLIAPILICLLLLNRATPNSLAEITRTSSAVLTFESFTIHGPTVIGPIFANAYVTQPQHGTLAATETPGMLRFSPFTAYVGPDSFIYTTCTSNDCTDVNVNLNIVNQAPIAGADEYTARGPTSIGPLMANDSDPDGDPMNIVSFITLPAHGSLQGTPVGDVKIYTPGNDFTGTDSFTYLLCDQLQLCSSATVTLHVPGDGENAGACDRCNGSVGEPINVSNGNMFLPQTDYALPSIGPAINVTRTFNSDSQSTGLFGRGWSSQYDESIAVYDNSLTRFNQGDGRAIYLGRPVGSSGAYSPLEGDFHGQLSQTGGFTLTMKDGSVEQFNSSGKLLSQADRNGNQTTLGYDPNGKLASITDPFGRVLTVTTNTNGQVLSVSDAMGLIATYTYGAGAELLSVTYADNSAFHFSYDANFRLTIVTDALGNVLESHSYDGQGRALTSEKQNGVEHYSLNYVSDTETDVTDALGRITKYTFDKSKGRNVVTRVEGLCSCGGGSGSRVRTWTYDNQLNVTAETDALGHLMSYTYDANGNRLTATDPTGTVTFTYNGFAEVLTRTDQLNGVTANTYDAAGDFLTTTNALGKTTAFTYGPRGLLLTVTDARGKVSSFAYDASGNLITRTDALSRDTQFAYDARGRLTSTTNALGNVTAFAYDPFGRLNLVTQADGSAIGYEYDLAGRRTAMTDAKGNRSTYAYDGAYRLTSQTDAANQTTSYGYDAMSNLTAASDALSRVTNYDYDEFNRLVKVTYPPATAGATRLFETVNYDADGNATQRTDPAARTTIYLYDSVNRVVSTTDAANQTTNFEYDPLSRMTALVDAIGQRYRFTYDAIGQLKKMHRGQDAMSFTYDPVGNRKERTDYNGALTTYDYDAVNRLKTISYPDTTTVAYTYDKLSRLQTATNENGAVNFDYNKMNRLTTVTDVFGQILQYNYDDNGNRTKLTLNSAIVETYKYDAVDRLTKILDAAGLAFTFDYDATSKLTQKKAPNGVKTAYQYDGLDRLTRLLDTKGVTTIADHQYQYNPASQITQIAEPTITRSYGYDSVDRLTSANYSNPLQPHENYAYDGVGNRTASQLSASYSYQRFNRLTSTSSATYSYDANGNLVSKIDSTGTTQYTWDFENRLRQVTLPNGNTVNYKYDALGRRIQRTPGAGVSTNFVYDGQDVVKDLNSDGSTVDYLNGLGIDNKLRLTDSRQAALGPLYFLQDHLGSTTALTNSLGVSVAQVAYDSFGNSSGNSLTRYDYTGRERDAATGLMYHRARWYDPQVGRFVSEDPTVLAGGINQFTYVHNNAQNATDPSGLYDVDVHYYLTYYLAMKTGCFQDWEARQIAEGDLHSDEDADKKPGWGKMWIMTWHGPVAVPDEAQRRRNADFHAFGTPQQNAIRAAQLLAQASQGGGNLWAFGTYLHFLQDSYSHREYAGNTTWGQSSGGESRDHTSFDKNKAMEMAHDTYDKLREFGEQRGCRCHGDPDWNAVGQFIDVGYGRWDPRELGWHVTNEQLREKIGILNVSWRSSSGR